MKKRFIIVGKLSAKRFAEPHSDWQKLLFGPQTPVRGLRNLKCILHHTPTVCQNNEDVA